MVERELYVRPLSILGGGRLRKRHAALERRADALQPADDARFVAVVRRVDDVRKGGRLLRVHGLRFVALEARTAVERAGEDDAGAVGGGRAAGKGGAVQ